MTVPFGLLPLPQLPLSCVSALRVAGRVLRNTQYQFVALHDAHCKPFCLVGGCPGCFRHWHRKRPPLRRRAARSLSVLHVSVVSLSALTEQWCFPGLLSGRVPFTEGTDARAAFCSLALRCGWPGWAAPSPLCLSPCREAFSCCWGPRTPPSPHPVRCRLSALSLENRSPCVSNQ